MWCTRLQAILYTTNFAKAWYCGVQVFIQSTGG